MQKPMRKIARISTLTGVALAGMLGLSSLSGGVVLATSGLPIEVAALNQDGGFVISYVGEGTNTIKAMLTATEDPNDPEYIVSKYHLFWGEVSDEKLPEMVESNEGVTTIAMGTDGETMFMRSWYPVEFQAPEGTNLTDNSTKVISYAVEVRALKPGHQDKIIAGRFSYSRCANSEGYNPEEGAFCSYGTYASGEIYYDAYDRDWRKLKSLPEVKYVEKVVWKEVPAKASVVVTGAPASVKAAATTGNPAATRNLAVTEASTFPVSQGATTGVAEDGGLVADNVSTDSVSKGNENDVKEVVEVPELGKNGGDKSYLMWWLGFVALLSIGALGAFSWFFWPILPIHKKKADKTGEKHK